MPGTGSFECIPPKGTKMGTLKREPQEYSRNTIGIYIYMLTWVLIFLLKSWGCLAWGPSSTYCKISVLGGNMHALDKSIRFLFKPQLPSLHGIQARNSNLVAFWVCYSSLVRDYDWGDDFS